MPVIYTDLSLTFPEMSVITDQSDLLPVMLMIKITQFFSPEMSVITDQSDLLPVMLMIKITQFFSPEMSVI
jgi:hypothetical protein